LYLLNRWQGRPNS